MSNEQFVMSLGELALPLLHCFVLGHFASALFLTLCVRCYEALGSFSRKITFSSIF